MNKSLIVFILLIISGSITADEFLRNGDFSNGFKSWLFSSESATITKQILTLTKESDSKKYPWVSQDVNVTKGELYQVDFEYLAGNMSSGGEVRLEFPTLKTGIIKPIVNYNTIWNHETIVFNAQDSKLKLIFRVWPGENISSEISFRNIILQKAGEALPALSRKASKNQPWGYKIDNGICEDLEDQFLWTTASGLSEINVTTSEIWPENDYNLSFSFGLLQATEQPINLKWVLEPLGLNYNLCGNSIHEEIPLKTALQAVNQKFKFSSKTVFVRLRWLVTGSNPIKIKIDNPSLRRLQLTK